MAKKDTKVQTELRQSLEISQNLPFDKIIAENEHKYDFCIINDAKGSVQRHEMKGWKIWKGDNIYGGEFEQAMNAEASKTSDGFTSVPCGIAGDGKQTRAYLMYAEKGTIDKLQKMKDNENALRKQAYGQTARQNAASVEGGVQSYAPKGMGQEGLTIQPTTIHNQS